MFNKTVFALFTCRLKVIEEHCNKPCQGISRSALECLAPDVGGVWREKKPSDLLHVRSESREQSGRRRVSPDKDIINEIRVSSLCYPHHPLFPAASDIEEGW